MTIATTTPAVTLNDITTLDDEALLVGYGTAKAAGDTHQANRYFTVIAKRVKPTVTAAANAVVDANDRDIAVSFATAKIAMDEVRYQEVLKQVRNGKTLANCIAAHITVKNLSPELDQGRYVSSRGTGGGRANVYATDFTADETMRTVAGSSYSMDALEDALDAALFDAPTAADEACGWFRETTNGHLTTDEQDVLLHSTGLTREVDNYLDDIAITDPARAARAFNAVNPNSKNARRRTSPARLPQEDVAIIVGTHRSSVSRDIDSAENAIYANTGLTRELRRGIDGTRRVIFEDITAHLIDWLKTYAEQAGVTADETTVRAIPQAYWVTVMDEFGYDIGDYSDNDIADIIDAVIAGVVA